MMDVAAIAACVVWLQNLWVTLDVAMHGQLMDAPCVAPSRVTQKDFAVLVE